MQVKIGFDKFPVPSISTEVPLVDIVTGEKLVDEVGIPLVTDTGIAIEQIGRSNNSSSIVLDPETIEPIRVREIFQESTETSTTLLGIDRAETQLSLFSDVSTLGLDEKEWEVFNFTSYFGYGPWDNRGTKSFGNHYNARMREETQEQAIQIGSFPVPYTYPFPPRFADQGLFNQSFYDRFVNFILLGNILYNYYSGTTIQTQFGSNFKDKFLDGSKVSINNDNEIEYIGITEAQGLVLIDEWTRTWVDITSNRLLDPRDNRTLINSQSINTIVDNNPSIDNTRPGYNSNPLRFSLLQSRRAFRYQPGRISGFTFGAKSSSDSGSNSNIMEWGISNPTDQYMFRIQGANFSIVRRSAIPLELGALARSGLTLDDQKEEGSLNPFDNFVYHTIIIPREKFNGDPVNGNGRSGYLLNPSLVTMFKIEFGWYGAIGARFYAYIPVNNNESRWVVLHTIVIENSLGKPCLEDPFFKFSYSVSISDSSTLRTPQFLYKYGSSMYIDGGDEGTVTQHSYSSLLKNINKNNPKSIIGIYPKLKIINIEGTSKDNKKVIIPKDLSVSSDVLSKIEIARCRACPGFGHHYNEGLYTEENGRKIKIRFVGSTRGKIEIVSEDEENLQLFTHEDVGSKLVSDGIWATYISRIDEEFAEIVGDEIIGYTQAFISRISNTYQKIESGLPETVSLRNGELAQISIPVGGNLSEVYGQDVLLSNYSAIAGSNIPLTGSKIKIQFLNSLPRSNGHYNEFLIGITDKQPVESFDSGLKWKYGEEEKDDLEEIDTLFGEWIPSTRSRNRNGIENGEANYPREYLMEIDYRIPNPPGLGSGRCSNLIVEVLGKNSLSTTLINTHPVTGLPGWFLRLQPGVRFPEGSLIGGEIGVNGLGTGISFISEQDSFKQDNNDIYFAEISNQIPGFENNSSVIVEFTQVKISGTGILKFKIFKFNPYPLYLFAKLRDNSRINSISISEELGESTVSSSPNWILNNKALKDNYNSSAVAGFPPTNFTSEKRLDSASIDKQLEQNLRPSRIVDTFFIGSNKKQKISLKNIYNIDKETITPDLFNLEATFIVASVLPIEQASTGLIQITLNTSEQ
jgi:hypothetical protein